MPPSTLIGNGQGKWSRKDRAIVLAHHLYEKSLCKGCAGPTSEWDTEQDYVPQEHVCPKCAAQDRYQAENAEPDPGTKVVFLKENPEADYDDVAPVFAD